MCGIVGTLDWSGQHPPDIDLLKRMLGTIRHRGPDEFGLYVDQRVGIGSARLSIIDLTTGQQPIPNVDLAPALQVAVGIGAEGAPSGIRQRFGTIRLLGW